MNQKRDSWEFSYSALNVLNAAKDKARFHHGRVKWWKQQQNEVMKTVKAKGLEIEEDIAANYNNATKVLHGARIVVDDRLQGKLNECHEKLRIHGSLAKTYDSWVEVLSSVKPTHRMLELTHDDYLFFFGK